MQKRLQPILIRTLRIDPPLLLAPMAGLTHTALRQIIAGFGGVGLLSTEMLAAKRLPAENPAISPYLVRTAPEKPLSYQLLVSRPEEIAQAVDVLHKAGADAVDLNLGCPAPAVNKMGAGIRLMELPDQVRLIVAEARKRTPLPLSAKIRLGIEPDERKLKAFCEMLQDEGIDFLSVHARFKQESFARTPRWEAVSKIKDWLAVPVIVNGGIFSVRDAEDCLNASGADGLMIGRAAAAMPWLFAEIARQVFGSPVAEQEICLPALYSSFTDLLTLHFRPEHRLGRLKEFTHYFAKNYQFGHYLASRVQSSHSLEEAQERALDFFDKSPK